MLFQLQISSSFQFSQVFICVISFQKYLIYISEVITMKSNMPLFNFLCIFSTFVCETVWLKSKHNQDRIFELETQFKIWIFVFKNNLSLMKAPLFLIWLHNGTRDLELNIFPDYIVKL